MNWKNNLKQVFKEIDKRNKDKVNSSEDKEIEDLSIEQFLVNVVKSAFLKLQTELNKYGRETSLENQDFYSALTVKFNNEEEFYYEVKVREESPENDKVYTVTTYDIIHNKSDNGGEELTSYPRQDLGLISEEHIISDFIRGYQQHLLYQ